MEKSKDKYHIEMRFYRIIGCGWIALCTVGLVGRALAGLVGLSVVVMEGERTVRVIGWRLKNEAFPFGSNTLQSNQLAGCAESNDPDIYS
ncbi:MAG: hypothetical protein ABIJ50_13365 [Pseudomonadota bacterium]